MVVRGFVLARRVLGVRGAPEPREGPQNQEKSANRGLLAVPARGGGCFRLLQVASGCFGREVKER